MITFMHFLKMILIMLQIMYEDMKRRIENVVENGKVAQYITSQQEHEAFSPWTKTFTHRDHPTVIQVYYP